jgi:hypothetical protein
MKFFNKAKHLIAVLFLICNPFTAKAALITIDFGGTLTSTFGTLTSGQAFSGSYTFDAAVAATGASTSSFSAFNNLLSASLTIGSFTATVGPGSGLPEIQQDDVAGADRYALLARNAIGSSQVGGLDIDAFGFRLDDTSGTAITDALVLLASPSLANFTGNSLFIFFGSFTGPSGFVDGRLTSLSVRNTNVPEPEILLLLGAAAASFSMARKRVNK